MTNLLGAVRLGCSWIVARVGIRSERGATAVEYGLMIALIAAFVLAAVAFLGQQTSNSFQCTADSVRQGSAAC